jgi:hypothetical protein
VPPKRWTRRRQLLKLHIRSERRKLRNDVEHKRFLLTEQSAVVKDDSKIKYGKETVMEQYASQKNALVAFTVEAHKVTTELFSKLRKKTKK